MRCPVDTQLVCLFLLQGREYSLGQYELIGFCFRYTNCVRVADLFPLPPGNPKLSRLDNCQDLDPYSDQLIMRSRDEIGNQNSSPSEFATMSYFLLQSYELSGWLVVCSRNAFFLSPLGKKGAI